MEAVLHVKGLAYCKIEIEDANMPASFNLIDHIIMQEGFGIAVPTLTLYLFDQTGTLQTDMNLVQGTKCSISIARDGESDQITKRTFSLWGMKRGITNEGPHLQVVFILDVPKWSAGVYCENFRATSSDVMQQLASRAGLQYDGPGSTDDSMNWLNINTTRASFSEDVAMRGYGGNSSCMARVLTLDSKVRYKDLFKVMRESEMATLLLNVDSEGVNPYPAKEAQESTLSGVMAHWFNYGAIQHEHSLNDNGQQVTDKIYAPVLGDAFPISDRVKGLMSDAVASRVTYTGMDPGTEPKPGSNIHQYYERALYQNLRGLGLFSERTRVLLTVMTDIFSFDCVKYLQHDPVGHHLVPSKSLNGKYLVGGKTIRLKNGHTYSEVLDILRPYVSNPGESEVAGMSNGGRREEANSGPFNLVEESQPAAASTFMPQASVPTASSLPKPEVRNATNLMDSLQRFDTAIPSVPSAPLPGIGGMTASSPVAAVQRDLRNTIQEINRTPGQLRDALESSRAGFNPESHHTIKRIAGAAIKTSANATIDAIRTATEAAGRPINGLKGLADSVLKDIRAQVEMPVMDRFQAQGLSAQNLRFDSVVSTVSAAQTQVGDFIADIQKGGLFVEDFLVKGLETPVDAVRSTVDAITQQSNLGANFAFPASNFGLSAQDVAIQPKEVANFLLDYVEERKNPAQFLKDKGADLYQEAFGSMTPAEAKRELDLLKQKAEDVGKRFTENEFIVDPLGAVKQEADNIVRDVRNEIESAEQRLQRQKDQLLSMNPAATVKGSVMGSGESITDSLRADLLNRRSGDTDYSQVMDFMFGQEKVYPLLEKIVEKRPHESSPLAEIVRTVREAVSWAEYTRIGSSRAINTNAEDVYWEFPHTLPFAVLSSEQGSSYDMEDSTPRL